MQNANHRRKVIRAALLLAWVLLAAGAVWAQDWPQWRGPNRDARATGFKAPKTWPKELKEVWKVKVGDGVATPALVGDKLYVFTREGDKEVIRCLDMANKGKEVWKDEGYKTEAATGGAKGFPGPRCSPAVAEGKVVTLGLRGTLSCLDAADGKLLWRKDDIKGYPQFFTSSSPMIIDGLCIAQLGGDRSGAVVAYQLADGKEKWKWAGEGTAYSSPVLLKLGDDKVLVVETSENVVALSPSDGKRLWKAPFAAARMVYNAATPIVEGQTVIYAGSNRPTRAVKLEKKGGEITGTELWSAKGSSVKFNTPVLKDGYLYGISERDQLFCVNAKDGKQAWTASAGGAGGRSSGYGSVVDAGDVLMALTPGGQLIVFKPNTEKFEQVAKYKVGDRTYAYPIASGNRIIVKDRDSVIVWAVE